MDDPTTYGSIFGSLVNGIVSLWPQFQVIAPL